MYKKILVPLDGSPLAEAVLPHAQALAKSEGAEIVILRVPDLPAPDLFTHNPAMANKIVEDSEIESDRYLKEEVKKIKGKGVKVTGLIREGPVPDTILAAAKETHADMIAMSTHGRSGIQRWLIGSVADRVVHFSPIPVMLIHPSPN
jgi:nucleotide-binding universal stress UspA family protein